tara:strand:+ start:1955 stop:2461 length:507 start_codon:yes stop_codon:yes gene_type:complete
MPIDSGAAKEKEEETGFADSSVLANYKKMFTEPEELGDQNKRKEFVEDLYKKEMRLDGTEKPDDEPVKQAAPATTTTTTEETTETTTEEKTDVDKAKDAMVAAANATAASSTASTPATQAAAEPKKRGQKGGTIATSPQGISMDDDTGLRPFRGLLADETKKKKTLIA